MRHSKPARKKVPRREREALISANFAASRRRRRATTPDSTAAQMASAHCETAACMPPCASTPHGSRLRRRRRRRRRRKIHRGSGTADDGTRQTTVPVDQKAHLNKMDASVANARKYPLA